MESDGSLNTKRFELKNGRKIYRLTVNVIFLVKSSEVRKLIRDIRSGHVICFQVFSGFDASITTEYCGVVGL